MVFIFFKQKTAYEMRISDWRSDVCSSDLLSCGRHAHRAEPTYVPLSQASRTAPANPVSEAVFDGSRLVSRASSRWMRRQAGGLPNCYAEAAELPKG